MHSATDLASAHANATESSYASFTSSMAPSRPGGGGGGAKSTSGLSNPFIAKAPPKQGGVPTNTNTNTMQWEGSTLGSSMQEFPQYGSGDGGGVESGYPVGDYSFDSGNGFGGAGVGGGEGDSETELDMITDDGDVDEEVRPSLLSCFYPPSTSH